MRPTTTIMAPNAFGDGYWQLATAPRERSSNTTESNTTETNMQGYQ